MPQVAIASQTVRISWERVSLTDGDTYYHDFDGLTTPPDVIDAFQKRIEADSEFQTVIRSVRTTLV